MPTSPHKRTLYIVLADHFILHTPVISTPPLPATLCLLYLYTHIYISLSLLTYPTHCLAHEPPPPSLLTDSQHAAGKRASLPESHLQLLPETERKRARPPRPMSSTFQFYPLLVWLRCQLRPVTLLFARCYPIASSCTPSLCPGLPWKHPLSQRYIATDHNSCILSFYTHIYIYIPAVHPMESWCGVMSPRTGCALKILHLVLRADQWCCTGANLPFPQIFLA